MKQTSIILASIILLSSTSIAMAVSGNSNTPNNNPVQSMAPTQQKIVTTSPSPSGTQVKNQVQTQNQGQESQLKVNTAEQTNLGGESSGKGTAQPASGNSLSAKEQMNNVDEKVEALLSNNVQGGIGEQVRLVAQEQKQIQQEIKTQLQKVDNRQGLLKSILGPDYKALKIMQQQLERNQIKIEQLQQLNLQVTSQVDKAMISEAISALVDQNANLSETYTIQEQSRSMLGWLLRLFV